MKFICNVNNFIIRGSKHLSGKLQFLFVFIFDNGIAGLFLEKFLLKLVVQYRRDTGFLPECEGWTARLKY